MEQIKIRPTMYSPPTDKRKPRAPFVRSQTASSSTSSLDAPRLTQPMLRPAFQTEPKATVLSPRPRPVIQIPRRSSSISSPPMSHSPPRHHPYQRHSPPIHKPTSPIPPQILALTARALDPLRATASRVQHELASMHAMCLRVVSIEREQNMRLRNLCLRMRDERDQAIRVGNAFKRAREQEAVSGMPPKRRSTTPEAYSPAPAYQYAMPPSYHSPSPQLVPVRHDPGEDADSESEEEDYHTAMTGRSPHDERFPTPAPVAEDAGHISAGPVPRPPYLSSPRRRSCSPEEEVGLDLTYPDELALVDDVEEEEEDMELETEEEHEDGEVF